MMVMMMMMMMMMIVIERRVVDGNGLRWWWVCYAGMGCTDNECNGPSRQSDTSHLCQMCGNRAPCTAAQSLFSRPPRLFCPRGDANGVKRPTVICWEERAH